MSDVTTKRTACNRDCPDACEVLATVQDGRVTRLSGAADHPVTRGFLCHRTSRFLQRQYAADRLLRPMRRAGDQWREITWDDALDQIAEAMLRIRAESGAAAILHYRSGGSLGIMKHVTDWFFQRFGPVTTKSGDVCSGAGEAAQVCDFGVSDSNDLLDLKNSRAIILWGKNVFVSNVHLLPLLREARQSGTKLVLIDPVHQRTAQICDMVIQPRAGGDAALACGVARWLLDQQRHDHQATAYCEHWPDYVRLIRSRSLAQWAEAADVAEHQLVQLAQCYADGPSAILVGWGMQRRRWGATTVRAIDALASMSGNIGIRGGGVSFYFRRRGAFDFSFAHGPAAARTIPEPQLGTGILEAQDPSIRLAWVTAGNPVTMLPQSATVAGALQSRELTVVVDSFLTDTARCADLVLPTTTFLEEDDLIGSYGHHWIARLSAAVAPPSGVLTDYQIVQQLAARVGLAEEFSESAEIWMRRLLRRVEPLGVSLEQLAHRAIRNPLASDVLFADRRFPTASGKINLLTQIPAACLQPHSDGSLRLAALSTDQAQSSQWTAQQQQGPAVATIHPAVAPGACSGQLAELESSLGTLRVKLSLDPNQRRDVVLMDKGGWLSAGRCANALIAAELTDDGQGAVYYDTSVRLRVLDAATTLRGVGS
jgi:anaerobic selenocysteine-containing dehydrogenase